MALEPVSPGLLTTKPLSQSARGGRSVLHPLLSPSAQTYLRAEFSISDWLLMGSCLQALIILLSPYPAIYSLTPAFALAIYKIAKTVLVANGVLRKPHMKDVRLGRTTAVFPESDGSFNREKGESFGGEGVCVMLLSSKCNHPLGMLYPPYATLLSHGQKMFTELERNAVEYGFLGTSGYVSTDHATKPVGLQIIYFKDLEHCYKFAHSAAPHRKGWDWFNGMGKGVDCVTIAHEVFDVPKGRWENIWVNARPYGFAATAHAVRVEGKEVKWVCPILDAKKTSGKQRLGAVKD